ncbi:hypothetical protein NSQ93_22325 [Bacillus sp. FSL W8-0445]|uniref:hypothetical protein n=1 Tax=Bacillota TaxID=1239 RepID=UPI000779B6E6|nr:MULTISPECIES: hypothetical protein [Bacillota]KYC77077.1 hypothetical protein B4092_4814 [Bacillus licheniformis]MDE1407050.1 hypothetical protein [Bacillus licheniformis]NFT30619.1 hypothetical protein [Clostridium sporogenes]OJT57368.1 hypothetical protein BFP47_11710 [Bacillus licheniformis]OJT69990.1 hypothetical protein BFP46_05180 [Bacillus licheniformis]
MLQVFVEVAEQFIQSLSLPSIAKGILKSEDDCDLFFKKFYKRNRSKLDDLLDFKEYKISNSQMTLDRFLDNCRTYGIHKIFEETFMQSFSPEDIEIINKALDGGRVTLEKIYINFVSNPHKNIMKNVL